MHTKFRDKFMSIKKYKTFSYCLIFFLFSQVQLSYGKGKDYGTKDDTDIYDPNKKKIPPLPRHILFPEVTYSRAPDIEGEYTLDFSKHKFWIIAMIASWNQRSSEITKIFNSHMQEFNEHDIGILGLFTQNTEQDVEKWRLINKPLFDNYFASRNLVDNLKNPKIPMLWLVGAKGEILLKYELPTIQQIDTTIEKSFILTSF